MARFTRRLPSPAMVVALVALCVALSGTAIAATGGSFVLGQPNTATSQSALTANEAGKALQITNTSADPTATPLGLKSAAGNPPFTTNSKTKVANLNADLLDNLNSSQLQRRVAGACAAGQAMTSIATSGTPGCTAFSNMQELTNTVASGGFPYSGAIGSFATDGGPLLEFSTSSGWRATPGNISEDVIMCPDFPCTTGNDVQSLKMFGFASQVNSHTNLQTAIGFMTLPAGTYYLNIYPDAAAGGQLQTDTADEADVVVLGL